MNSDKAKICWLSGNYFKRRDFLENLENKHKDSMFIYLDEENYWEYFYKLISNNSCFQEKRIFIINHSLLSDNKASVTKKIKNILEKNIPNNTLIVFNDLDKKKEKSLYNLAKKIGKEYSFPDYLNKQEFVSFSRNRIKEINLQIDFNFLENIILNECFVEGKNKYSCEILEMLLRKIALLNINQDDNDILYVSLLNKEKVAIWDLFRSLDEKDIDKSLNILSVMIDKSKKSWTEQFAYVVNMLFWRYRLIWFLKEGLITYKSHEKISNMSKDIIKIDINYNGMYTHCNYSLDNSGNYIENWKPNVVDTHLNGFYGNTPAIELYNRSLLYMIIKSIYNSYESLKKNETQEECLFSLYSCIIIACSKLNIENIKSIHNVFEKE